MSRRLEIKARMEAIDTEADDKDKHIVFLQNRILNLKARIRDLVDEEERLRQELNELNRQEAIRETGLFVGQTLSLIADLDTRERVRATITKIEPGSNFPVVWARKEGGDFDIPLNSGAAAQAALLALAEEKANQ